MVTFEKLSDAAQPTPSAKGSCGTLELDHDKGMTPTLRIISNYFKEDEQRGCVELIIGGEKAGYLHRTHFDALCAEFGVSDYSISPGEGGPPKSITLCCPVIGCDYKLFVMGYDEDHPPKCKIHLDADMKREDCTS